MFRYTQCKVEDIQQYHSILADTAGEIQIH